MRVVVPLRKGGPYLDPSTKSKMTHLMGIINLSPDSFSDGGVLRSSDLSSIRKAALSHIKNGARILDVGGQSTKPHAKMISAAEEMSRIIPAIRTLDALRTLPEADHVIVSVDTYRAEVARAAVEAGADIVNDVSAGSLDPAMLSTVANLGCTVCMAHLRGSPETMNSLADYPNGVVDEVGKELVQRLYEAERAGIRRWRIILDPGIGFAKTSDHNLEILRSFSALRATAGLTSLPWLVGTSRKAFIGKITGVETPRDRSIGTAVSVAAAIQGGSDIVRVHDIANMNQAVRMAQAIWRPIRSDMTGASDLSSESDA